MSKRFDEAFQLTFPLVALRTILLEAAEPVEPLRTSEENRDILAQINES